MASSRWTSLRSRWRMRNGGRRRRSICKKRTVEESAGAAIATLVLRSRRRSASLRQCWHLTGAYMMSVRWEVRSRKWWASGARVGMCPVWGFGMDVELSPESLG
ncbi:hypothetical protein KC19_10G025700 [Ceratodon purpureus]|uniref:Uncharacterized protein n=1 Tax=Ceratodon purpureus TaxID=3225 RepID=A0A8T0GH98_CERPU|nr:hypothetical protein KC19_10G025700 [Ceratodon purpureus]